ncbi:hypothetical protein kam1_645 [Methylacidiphilum kamchatkense Kam1]|uniref:Uncharacterized protein n=1 Tax=Methylacidiphilum kamchatkense Kam1 TaxID=1202785 RepID=A0A516TKY1_9BACT|nr:hypothetical protein kam1_645 [Methylacidiphilum kamchatkense Kam1]
MLIEKESTMKFVFRMVLDVNFTVKQVLLIGKKGFTKARDNNIASLLLG